MFEQSKYRVAIVGCGIGARQARAFAALPGYELVGFCDTDLSRAKALAAEFGVAKVTNDFADVCTWDHVNIVSLCTPPAWHFSQIRQTLLAGKNVICEKPLVGSLHDLDVLADLSALTQRWVMPIFQLRFGAGARKLRHLIDLGITGPLNFATVETAWSRGREYYHTTWRRTWEGSLGGCLFGHGVHAHDLFRYLGGHACAVTALATTRINAVDTEDCAVALLQLAGGGLASHGVTLGSWREITRLRLCFKHLTAESNSHPYETSSDPWTFTPDTASSGLSIERALADFRPGPEGYLGQFSALSRTLLLGEELPVNLTDARHSVELATALYFSIVTGKRVTLPIATAHPFYAGWQNGLKTHLRNPSGADPKLAPSDAPPSNRNSISDTKQPQ